MIHFGMLGIDCRKTPAMFRRVASAIACTIFFPLLQLPWVDGEETSDRVGEMAEAQYQRWFLELTHPEWRARERSWNRLKEAGLAVLPNVKQAVLSPNPELSLRAASLLSLLYTQPMSDQDIEAVENVVEELLSVSGSAGEELHRAWETQRLAREHRALRAIETLGGGIHLSPRNRQEDFEQESITPLVEFIVIGPRWKGGDSGLRYIRRLSQVGRVYQVKNAPVSPEAIQQLEQAGYRVELRGAFLGIRGSVPVVGPDSEGCVIDSITPNSPAEKAGLQPQDIIVKFGDHEVRDFNELIDYLKAAEPGQEVPITILRQGELRVLPTTLGAW
ncbi:MAG: hypothetical protein KatS3mg113_0791 [Planctomycetaceae bacterium]|nr:MAG: hypothetical protein KatS3mg113_0791 [Planctomycetaceae bacterium]